MTEIILRAGHALWGNVRPTKPRAWPRAGTWWTPGLSQIHVLSSSGEDFVTVAFSGSLIVRFSVLSTRGALPGVPPRILGSSFLPEIFRMDTDMSRLPHPA